MPFPLVKLVSIAIKQVSKPLANSIKFRAKTNPFLRNRILLPAANVYHKFDTTIRMRILGLGQVVEVKPLKEEASVDLAAEMLGEFIIFSIAAGVLFAEYMRSSYKEQKKENLQNQRLKSLETEICNLNCQIEEQSNRLRHVYRTLKLPEIEAGQIKIVESNPKSTVPDTLTDRNASVVLQNNKNTEKS